MLSHRFKFYVLGVLLAVIFLCGETSATQTDIDDAIKPITDLLDGRFAAACQIGGVGFGLFQMISKGAFVMGAGAIVGVLAFKGISSWLTDTYSLMI